MAGSQNPYIYIITALPNATNGMVAQAPSWNGQSDHQTYANVAGIGNVSFGFIGDVSNAAAISAEQAAARETSAVLAKQAAADAKLLGNIAKGAGPIAGGLGVVQVGIHAADKDFNVENMSVGDLLNLTAAASVLLPGVGLPIAFTATGLSAAYSLYENKYGEITIGEMADAWDNTVFASLDGRNPEFGKGILEKLLKLTDWLNGGFDWLGDKFNDYFGLNRSGKFHVIVYDPLVLDLDGDGVELIAENNWNGVLFDFNGNGIKTATQWVSSDDGLLVWDRNKNGKIDNGSELFGEDTPYVNLSEPVTDGFTALRTIDSHPDGEINAKDSEWKNLRVWRDLNQDGEVQDGELFTLDELEITSLNLKDGLKKSSSNFTKNNGKKYKLADVNFKLDTIHSEYIDHIEIPDDYLSLPNLHGVGMLRDLREASVLSQELYYILQLYQNANTRQEQLDLLPKLMQEWAETNSNFNFNNFTLTAGGVIGSWTQDSTAISQTQAKRTPVMN